MIYVFSDGSLASDGTIDSSVGGRGKGVWTADNANVAATYFLVYNPAGKPQPAQSNPEMSLQIGYFNPDGSQNTTSSPRATTSSTWCRPSCSTTWRCTDRTQEFPDALSGAQRQQHAGHRFGAGCAGAFQPLAGLVNGKVPG
jgi:hypothetical protein